MYSFPTDKTDENFMERLVRYEFGNAPEASDTDMLTRFTHDMEKIAGAGGTASSDASLTKALIAFAVQAYYDNRLKADQELFTTDGVTGGIRFDRNDVADSLSTAKGYTKYFSDYLTTFPVIERSAILGQLPDLDDWFIQSSGSAMTATAGEKVTFADGTSLGFADVVEQSLLATTEADYLFGYEEANTLAGGDGNDTILGNGGGDIFDLTALRFNDLLLSMQRTVSEPASPPMMPFCSQ